MRNLLSQSFNSEPKVTPGPNGSPGPAPGASVATGGAAEPCSPGLDLTAFNAVVTEVERGLELQARLMRDIQSMHEKSKLTVKAATVKDLAQRIQHSITEAARMAALLKESIVAIKQSNEENRSHPASAKGTAIDRHRSVVTRELTRKLKKNVDQLTQIRTRIERAQRAIIHQRIRVVMGQDLAAPDSERILQNGLGDEVLQAAVAEQGTGATDAVRHVLREVEERSAAVNAISKDLRELNQTVVDMAALVEAQRETLNQVEVTAGEAYKDVEDGRKDLEKARGSQKNTTQWTVIAIPLSIVLLLILTGVVIGILRGLGVSITPKP